MIASVITVLSQQALSNETSLNEMSFNEASSNETSLNEMSLNEASLKTALDVACRVAGNKVGQVGFENLRTFFKV